MNPADAYRINEPIVASQEIEGEAILIHFDTGCYYCANATGAVLIDLLRQGWPAQALGAALAGRFDVAPPLAAEAADRFIQELLREGLVVPADGSTIANPVTEPAGDRLPFEAPGLQRFDDLQDLLMLDPIHDVDQAGWPVPPPPGAIPPAGR